MNHGVHAATARALREFEQLLPEDGAWVELHSSLRQGKTWLRLLEAGRVEERRASVTARRGGRGQVRRTIPGEALSL